MNHLRKEDFVSVGSRQPFAPFSQGYFGDYVSEASEIKEPGIYRVRFTYSTSSKELGDYFGWPGLTAVEASDETASLFKRVSHVTLTSNELKLNFKKRAD